MTTILVVDDESEIRELMSRVLIREGYQVEEAAHGAAALDAIRRRDFDLVICNMRMPIMDGRALYAEVAARDPVLARRFVFCTGDIISPDVHSFLLRLDLPVLTKPFSIVGLCDIVRRSLSRHGSAFRLRPCSTDEHAVAPTYPR